MKNDTTPIHLNPYTRENACYRAANISANGLTTVFATTSGESSSVIAIRTNSAGLIPDENDLDADLFIIRR